MKNIIAYKNYKKFLIDYVHLLPNHGRGEFKRISQAIRIHTTTLSQIVNGNKDFSIEQSLDLCDYLGFNTTEQEYFVLLVNQSKASSSKAKEFYSNLINEFHQNERSLSDQFKNKTILDESVNSIFYSSWIYAGIHILMGLKPHQTIEGLMATTGLDRKKVREVVKFLIDNDLCVQKGNKFIATSMQTHIDTKSRYLNTHRINWRLKAINKIDYLKKGELSVSIPLTCSEKKFMKAKRILQETIKNIVDESVQSPPERSACINVDWFDFGNS